MPDPPRLEFGADPETVVAKSNDLVRGRHNFSTIEQRIFVAMVAQLDRDEDTFSLQSVPIRKVSSETNESDLYRRIDNITDRLLDRVIEIRAQDEQGREEQFVKYNVFSRCQYDRGSGVVKAKFTEDMRPFLLRLKEKFTLYLITVFLRLRSKYSTQIYELLKMRQGLSNLRMSVGEFRRTLGLEDKYKEFAQMKRRVIEQARGELKERADIYFTYRVIREGRRAKEIQFYIHENEAVTAELKEEVSALKDAPDTMVGRAGGEPDQAEERVAEDQETSMPRIGRDTGEKPSIDAKRMFFEDLSQEELSSLSSSEIDAIYQRAQSQVSEETPKAASSVLAYKTYNRMKQLWEER